MKRIILYAALVALLAGCAGLPTGVRSFSANPEGGVDYQSDTRTPEQIQAGQVKAEESAE